MTRPKRRSPERLAPGIQTVLDELGHGAAADALRVAAVWEEAVGQEVARHAEPRRLVAGTLDVRVDSSAFANELQLRSEALLDALRSALGETAPRALRFHL